MLAEEVNSLQAGAVTGLSLLQVPQAAAAPWDAGATPHMGAAHPMQLSRHGIPVPAKVDHPLGTKREFTAR